MLLGLDLLILCLVLCMGEVEAAKLGGKRCTRNSLNLGNIIEQLMKDYDTHLLPEAEGVNVTIELHVQVGLETLIRKRQIAYFLKILDLTFLPFLGSEWNQ